MCSKFVLGIWHLLSMKFDVDWRIPKSLSFANAALMPFSSVGLLAGSDICLTARAILQLSAVGPRMPDGTCHSSVVRSGTSFEASQAIGIPKPC